MAENASTTQALLSFAICLQISEVRNQTEADTKKETGDLGRH